MFQPRDVRALTGLLTQYVTDEGLRKTHAQNARRTAVEKFALDGMVERYEAVYNDLCGRP